MRINLFNMLLIDYLAISLRTLGHFPTEGPHDLLDYLSYLISCFVLGSFIVEFCFMYKKINTPRFYAEKKGSGLRSKTPSLEEDLKSVYFEGLCKEGVSEHWFTRNYNFFYLLRFFTICALIFNLQYLQPAQVITSLVVMLTFTVTVIYYQCQGKLFESTWILCFRIIQEVSMSLIMVVINIFAFDHWIDFKNQKVKIGFIAFLIVLLVTNIALEVLAAFVSFVNIFIDCWKKRSKKVHPQNVGSSRVRVKRGSRTNFHSLINKLKGKRRSKKKRFKSMQGDPETLRESIRRNKEITTDRKELVPKKEKMKFNSEYRHIDLSYSKVFVSDKKISIKTKRKNARKMGPGYTNKNSKRSKREDKDNQLWG